MPASAQTANLPMAVGRTEPHDNRTQEVALANQLIWAVPWMRTATSRPVPRPRSMPMASTLVTVYSDVDGTTPATNPIVADGDGFWPQRYVTEAAKAVVVTSADVALYAGPCPTSRGTGRRLPLSVSPQRSSFRRPTCRMRLLRQPPIDHWCLGLPGWA